MVFFLPKPPTSHNDEKMMWDTRCFASSRAIHQIPLSIIPSSFHKKGDLAGALSRKSLSSQKPSFLLLHSLARRWPPINGYVFCRCFIFVIFIRQEWDCSSGLMSAITPAATYLMSSTGEIQGEPIYGRYGNPSRNSVEAILARLEGAEHAMCFSSGNTGCKQKPGTTTL